MSSLCLPHTIRGRPGLQTTKDLESERAHLVQFLSKCRKPFQSILDRCPSSLCTKINPLESSKEELIEMPPIA
jgi:hypothetical protein